MILEAVQGTASALGYFGVSDLQLWIVEGDNVLWSMRSDGIKVSTNAMKHENFFTVVPLEDNIDAVTEVFPSSLGWSCTKEIVTSLQLASEKSWNHWKQFRVFNVPSRSRRMVLIAADSVKRDATPSARAEVCDQYLQKIAFAVSMKEMELDQAESSQLVKEAQSLLDQQVSAEAKLSRTRIALLDAISTSEIARILAEAGVEALDCCYSW